LIKPVIEVGANPAASRAHWYRERVDEEALLVIGRHPRLPAALEDDDVRQAGLDRHRRGIQHRRWIRWRADRRKYAVFGI
jgi:hypothetical protein